MRSILSSISTLILCSSFLVTAARAAPDEWYTYRYGSSRTGAQPYASDLSDPAKIGDLQVGWTFPAEGHPQCGPFPAAPPGGFKASPIVVNDTVFIGSLSGFFYALDAATGACKWQYPPKVTDPALHGLGPNWIYGIESSASFWDRPPNGAVIFGAQDPSLGPICPKSGKPCGSARLFALDAKTGDPIPIWPSDELIATVNGDTIADQQTILNPDFKSSLKELHQRMTWTSPLIFNNKAYVGIHDFGDSPIQVGRVIAVDLATGRIDTKFQFYGAGPQDSVTQDSLRGKVHGGGVWNALAADGTGVYFTTGNTRIPWCVYPYRPPSCPAPVELEPDPNHGLSMIRVDKNTGNIIWKFQPVPFSRDGDPDWGAGATVMSTSCGELIASVQKDGWSYAVNAGNGVPGPPSMRWQFPPTGVGSTFLDAVHGDDDYRRPGAAWNDVFIVRTGGESLPGLGHVSDGYKKLHALNACATTEKDRVRWIADIPNIQIYGDHVSYSTPTVTGGIVFIGTNEDPIDHKGHLVVLGDPSVVPPFDWRCSNTDITSPQDCTNAGYVLVPFPQVLANVAMPDGGSLAAMRNEPVLARGRVFVATHPCVVPRPKTNDPPCAFPNAGHVYMLKPVYMLAPEDIATIIPEIFAPDIVTTIIENN